MLNQQECLALKLIFRGSDDISKAIRERIDQAESTDWEETGVGFYSSIHLKPPLEKIPNIRMWEYNFYYPELPHGGSYMCTFIGKDKLELEAVAFGGADWPYPTDSNKFEEIGVD